MEINLQERNIGFEPMTSTLARLRSTTELIPQVGMDRIRTCNALGDCCTYSPLYLYLKYLRYISVRHTQKLLQSSNGI